PADELGIECGHVAGASSTYRVAIGNVGHAVVVVDDLRVAALDLDDLPEAVEAGAGGNRLAHLRLGRGDVVRDLAEHQHPRRQLHGDVDQILRSPALQHVKA